MPPSQEDEPIYGWKQIEVRQRMLAKYVANMRDPRDLELPPVPVIESRDWTRVVVVSFITGFAVGLAALWQFQEMRRRRQARLAAIR